MEEIAMKRKTLMIIAGILFVFVFLSACSSGGSGVTKQGLGIVTRIDRSADASASADGNAEADVVVAAVGLDSAGKIVSINIDSVQPQIAFGVDGKLKVADLAAEIKTKREIGDAYGMKNGSSIKKEWYQQIDALEAYLKGKTLADINAMKLTNGTADDLKTSCTITVTDFIEAVKKAINNAK
jgi:hypothetical protein